MSESTQSPSRRRFLGLASLGIASSNLYWPTSGIGANSAYPWAPTDPAPRPGMNSHPPVHIDSNENPYGPSEQAIAAMKSSFSQSCRYVHNPGEFYEMLGQHHKVDVSMIEVGFGSSEILKMSVEAFLGPNKNVVVAQPSYESIARYGEVYGAQTIRVPLNGAFRIDLKKMRAAVTQSTGLVYVCNPNNPTATVVSRDEMKDFLASMPDHVTVLIDEAYHHYVEDTSYATAIPFAQEGKAVVVSRTFSKIYGMAGLRLGYAVGREDLIRRMAPYKIWLNLNALTLAAARASLDDHEFVSRNQRLNAQTRRFVEEQATGLGLKCIPSQANFMMIDLKRPAYPVLSALRSREIYVGRQFPPLTNHMRVTLGTAEEMRQFAQELRRVLS